jgi:hypothetical protein
MSAIRHLKIETRLAMALCALGVILIVTNPWFTQVDDECAIIDVAAKPALQTINAFLGGSGLLEHPPLYDLFLHVWLALTAGNPQLLRLPSIVFYLLGVWFLAQAARHLAGDHARNYTLILALLWPYGFHYGRLTAWYAFSFLLISLLTLNYFKYLEHPSFRTWIPVPLCALALIYTNYFGWALLGCLGLDLLFRFSRDKGKWLLLLYTAIFLSLASLPSMPSLIKELHTGPQRIHSKISAIAIGIYNLYCLFVSESVAPWFWALGIAAGLAIVCTLLLAFIYSPPAARRFLLYFAALLTVMTFLQIGNVKRMMTLGPWLLLPIGTSLASVSLPFARRWLVASLAVVAAIGWYGIFSRKFYSAPHWVEPWEQIAREAADAANHGGVVIGNNPSFFFYLTYLLPATNPVTQDHFSGLLPDSVHAPDIYNPQQWIDAGSPSGTTTVLVDGLSFQVPGPPIGHLRPSLNARCKTINERRLVRDSGAKWKELYGPATGQRAWRIEVITYGDCSP